MTNTLSTTVDLLANFAILLGLIRWYLALNKLWTRKHITAVVGSLSSVNLSIGFVSVAVATLDSAAQGNIAQAATNLLDIFGVSVLFIVSVGVFVPANKGVNPLRLIWRSFVIERAEATNLLRTFTNPKGTHQILKIMQGLAAIDDQVVESEVKLIRQFTSAWGIEPPPLRVGQVDNPVSLEAVREDVIAYLEVAPPPEQAQQMVDLIALLVKADDEITEREQLILDEITALVAAYCADYQYDQITTYDVFIVPQTEKQRQAIRYILPGTPPQERLGGVTFLIGNFYSLAFAEAVAERYTAMNLYTTWEAIDVGGGGATSDNLNT